MRLRITPICLVAVLFAPSVDAATVLFNDFDGVADDIGPDVQVLYNGNGTASADVTTGITTSTGTNNATIGFNTSSTLDLSAEAGFTIEWVVTSYTGNLADITFNGWFFGIANSTSNTGTGLWNNAGESVGIVIEADTRDDWSFVEQTGGSFTYTGLNGAQATLASLADGFSISLTVNDDNTWSAFSTGLSNEINISGSMSSVSYASIASSVVANTSLQGSNAGGFGYNVDRVTITTIPEPSSALLLLGGSGLMLLRRRR